MSSLNVILIGITGVGKTTIGKVLAENLHKTFIDLDKKIEQHCGVDIPTIFEIEGETGFRNRETKELRRILSNNSEFVLSIGAGCILRKENRNLISNGSTVVVQLYADTDTLVHRLSKSATRRPLLKDTDVKSRIDELHNSRKNYYDSISDLKVNTALLKPFQVIAEIIAYLRSMPN